MSITLTRLLGGHPVSLGPSAERNELVEAQTSNPVAEEVTSEEAERFVQRFAEAWSGSDISRFEALWTDDIVLVQPMMPTTVGKAACREAFTGLFRLMPDLRATVHRWGATRDGVLIEFTLSGTFGGRPLSWPVVDRILLRDGLVAKRVSYFDTAPLVAKMLMRPRGWRQLLASGFRPSFRSVDTDGR